MLMARAGRPVHLAVCERPTMASCSCETAVQIASDRPRPSPLRPTVSPACAEGPVGRCDRSQNDQVFSKSDPKRATLEVSGRRFFPSRVEAFVLQRRQLELQSRSAKSQAPISLSNLKSTRPFELRWPFLLACLDYTIVPTLWLAEGLFFG